MTEFTIYNIVGWNSICTLCRPLHLCSNRRRPTCFWSVNGPPRPRCPGVDDIGHNAITRGLHMKILVAIDPSDSTHIALSKAAELAKKEGAQLKLRAA